MSAKIFIQGVPITKHPLYSTYNGMKTRCNNPNFKQYKDYGGRGVTVCKRWLDSFQFFVDDMGVRPTGYTLDRIDNEKGYEPSNCRWVSRKVQNNNQRERKVNYNNKIGIRGVSKTRNGKYRFDHKRKYYGTFNTLQDAIKFKEETMEILNNEVN